MSNVLETLSLHELNERENNLLNQLKKVKEEKSREEVREKRMTEEESYMPKWWTWAREWRQDICT